MELDLRQSLDEIRLHVQSVLESGHRTREMLEQLHQLIEALVPSDAYPPNDENPQATISGPMFSQQRAEPLVRENLAKRLYHERRLRDTIFGDAELFGEPAWDMLLDLHDAEIKRRRISITSACIASNVPATTALRWIGVLEQRGLVARHKDETDRRRDFLALTDKARALLEEFFSARTKLKLK